MLLEHVVDGTEMSAGSLGSMGMIPVVIGSPGARNARAPPIKRPHGTMQKP